MNNRRLSLALLVSSALTLSACATSPGYNSNPGYGSAPPPAGGQCHDCGTVTRIEMIQGSSNVPAATGAVVGGIVGAVAGREIAKHNTDSTGRRNTATVAGAAAGAVVGNAIQNRAGNSGSYNVYVRMDNGRETVVTQNDVGGIRQGGYVRVYNGRVWAR